MKIKPLCASMAIVSGLTLAGMGAAHADSYVSLFGGYTELNDTGFAGPVVKTNATFDSGYLLGAAYGLSLPASPNWRIEGEFSYRQNDVDQLRVGGSNLAGANGDVNAKALMFNAYYDFAPGAAWAPYLGAGIGGAQVEANNVRANVGTIADDDDTVFAYQFIGGLGFQVTPTINLFGEIRYFATEDPSLGNGVDFSYDTTNLLVGARFMF